MPHCRVRRVFQRRREEAALGCYSGGICYTMSPQLNCLSIFCCAEAYWNPQQEPEQVLADFGRLVFGEQRAAIGPLMEEFEVIPGWGHYPPFPYSPKRLGRKMAELKPLLASVDTKSESRLPLATSLGDYRDSLIFFTDLFHKCGTIAADLEEAAALVKASGNAAPNAKTPLALGELEQRINESEDFPQKRRLSELVSEIRGLDMRKLRNEYWKRVYGIYDDIPHPGDPRAEGATANLFRRFHYDLAVPR